MRSFAVAAVVVVSVLVSHARAATFSSSCDRFEIDGNSFGASDGTVDFADDFDDGSLAPNWSILLGTVTEAGTDLTAHDPGFTVQLGPTQFEISTVENVRDIENGAGNSTMTSY